ncbi:transcriptional regulation of mitochondrial recombination domain-containing protein [Trichoderma novae-zelandiae]
MNYASRPWHGQLLGLLRSGVRFAHSGGPRGTSAASQNAVGHGEDIWVFAHRRSEQVIYSFSKQLDGFHDLKQLPFNGKKTKPAKLRKDYWSPLAHIRFQPGQGSIGRSVFQKLRELKHLHEVAWSDEMRHKRPEEYNSQDKKKIAEEKEKGFDYQPIRSKKERGIALNAQKKNAIADMAYVLAGGGRGNKLVTAETDKGDKELVDVTVNWANDQDKKYAESWSENVTHSLLEVPAYTTGELEKDVEATKTTA